MLEEIQNKLKQNFADAEIEIIDDSASHAGHAGARGAAVVSHLQITIKSASLEALPRIKRHRQVNALLQEFYDRGLHSATISC